MDAKSFLAEQLAAEQTRLRTVAYKMLGSRTDAEDAVQEAWLRLSRADTGAVENLGGWLTTVVARVCLDMLRVRRSRREEPLDPDVREPAGSISEDTPDHEMSGSVGLALLVVLERLTPAERVAFVLHDMFDLPFEDIAPIIERSATAARQLASRARRRVQETRTVRDADTARRRRVVDAFLAASRGGDFEGLLAVLDPDVIFRADRIAIKMGAKAEIRGVAAVAETFKGRAQGASPALANGALALAVMIQRHLRVVLVLSFANEKIVGIEAIADPERLRRIDLKIPEG